MKLIRNIFLAAIVSVAGLFLIDFSIKQYTQHGKSVVIPDVTKMDYQEAIRVLEDLDLEPIVQDSVYSEEFRKFQITDQDPAVKRVVKEGRKVYLTINSLPKPKIRMPKLIDRSLTLSKALLRNVGLELGTIIEKYSLIGSGAVIQQYYRNDTIASGKFIEKGSKINLLVSKFIEIDSVYIKGIDTSKVIGWEYKQGFMNEKARKIEEKINKTKADSAKILNEEI